MNLSALSKNKKLVTILLGFSLLSPLCYAKKKPAPRPADVYYGPIGTCSSSWHDIPFHYTAAMGDDNQIHGNLQFNNQTTALTSTNNPCSIDKNFKLTNCKITGRSADRITQGYFHLEANYLNPSSGSNDKIYLSCDLNYQ